MKGRPAKRGGASGWTSPAYQGESMLWDKKAPSVDGYYWLKLFGNVSLVMVRDGQVGCFGIEEPWEVEKVSSFSAEWIGPLDIQKPE